jgi:hypothetical protein
MVNSIPFLKIVRVIGESYLGLIRVYIEYVHKDLRLRNGKPQKNYFLFSCRIMHRHQTGGLII